MGNLPKEFRETDRGWVQGRWGRPLSDFVENLLGSVRGAFAQRLKH